MPEEKLGIKETKEVLNVLLSLSKGLKASAEDGKLEWTDLTNVWPTILKMHDAIDGISNVDDELADLDQAEVAELVSLLISVTYNIIYSVKKLKGE